MNHLRRIEIVENEQGGWSFASSAGFSPEQIALILMDNAVFLMCRAAFETKKAPVEMFDMVAREPMQRFLKGDFNHVFDENGQIIGTGLGKDHDKPGEPIMKYR